MPSLFSLKRIVDYTASNIISKELLRVAKPAPESLDVVGARVDLGSTRVIARIAIIDLVNLDDIFRKRNIIRPTRASGQRILRVVFAEGLSLDDCIS